MPQSAEEAREWDALMRIIPRWAALNDEIFDLHQALDRIDILNPERLLAELQQFRADHHSLSVNVANMILLGDLFEGGDDASACAYGRWLADFETANPEMLDIVEASVDPHERFHETLMDIQITMGYGSADDAIRQFTTGMQPASAAVFSQFDQLIEIAARAQNLRNRAENMTMEQSNAYLAEAFGLLDNLIGINQGIAQSEVSAAVTQSAALKTISMLSMITGVVLAMMLGFFITRSISNPIRQIVEGMSNGAHQVSSAAGQVASSSQSQAEGASQQAAALEETSSSLEEMSAQTRQTAENSEQVLNIQESSKKVNALISEISAASKEQAQGIEQVNTGVTEMDKVVQQNAADSEESASAAEELSSQAAEMERMVAELEGMVGSSGKAGAQQKRKPDMRSSGANQHYGHNAQESRQQPKALKKPASGKNNGQSGQQARSRNESVIPLDDDDFKDF